MAESESNKDGFNDMTTARSPNVQFSIAARVASDCHPFADLQWLTHRLGYPWQRRSVA
ncbi:MAG TPA: hypothetical protein VGP33_10995 [Chloroflexota bacterium]|nr:hypothetical protein [Chloroflexota bacterium]